MKNFLQLVLMVFVWFTFVMVHKVHAQWQTSGSDIYYNNGNVGIGIINPTSNRLFLQGDSDFRPLHVFRKGTAAEKVMLAIFSAPGSTGNSPWNVASFWGKTNGMDSQDSYFSIDAIDSDGTGWASGVTVRAGGNVGIGTTDPSAKLTVNGTAKAEEVIVVENVGADFVFEEDYDLPELNEVESHIKKHKRLPEIPSAKEMIEHGVKVGALQMKLLQKIEELTLYVIELEKRDREKEKKIEILETKINIVD